ncbi:hypothetical protein QBC46DRAFT_411600 [Diplogelasinospora grovesii]|uniref:Uncharacterized protein n=1 Tax=Diplogelasinospora grovesii TaxID=303347 RepID=A0AAN6S0S1_9PEZI|nr:hypothetical protein QBC46DRAFT_411600 [Diplogelasinospora grovesii]
MYVLSPVNLTIGNQGWGELNEKKARVREFRQAVQDTFYLKNQIPHPNGQPKDTPTYLTSRSLQPADSLWASHGVLKMDGGGLDEIRRIEITICGMRVVGFYRPNIDWGDVFNSAKEACRDAVSGIVESIVCHFQFFFQDLSSAPAVHIGGDFVDCTWTEKDGNILIEEMDVLKKVVTALIDQQVKACKLVMEIATSMMLTKFLLQEVPLRVGVTHSTVNSREERQLNDLWMGSSREAKEKQD